MKALVGAFNQEKALVGAFSVIIQLHRLIDLRHYSPSTGEPVTHNQVEAHHQNQQMEGRLQKSLYLSRHSAQPEQSHNLQTWWQFHAALRNNTIRFRPSGCWKCWCKRMNSDWKHWEHRKGDRPWGRSRSQISGSGWNGELHDALFDISKYLLTFWFSSRL